MQNHPLRNQITQEVHARPFQRFKSNLGLVHIAAFYGAGGEQELSDALSQLLSKINVSMPETVDGFFYVENDLYGVRYEPHNEFYTLTLYQLDSAKVEKLTGLWESLPGELLCGVKIFFSGQQAKPNLKEFFGIHQVSGAEVMGGAAKVWTDFYPDDEMGFVTMVVHNTALKTFQAGRLLQRLCEIETYRHTALLAYPIAQALMPQLTEMDQSLSEITHEIATNADAPELLKRLMALAADVEALSAETANRMDRRLDPAKRTCIAANERLERLSRRIARATELIRSQVDLSIERQNQQLLEGLNDRARRQLRLQAKLESFTIIVVTYYAFDLLERSIRNTVSADILRDQVLMVLSCSVPIMAGVIWWYVRKLLKHYGDD